VASKRIGDLATEVAEKLQAQHVAEMEAAEHVDEVGPLHTDVKRSIFAKIEFSWRPSDAKALEQLRAAGDRAFREMYDEAITVMDNLYASVRVPQTNDEGIVLRDSAGRVLWQRDSRGHEIEDWSLLTGQDIETTLLDITRLRLALAPQLDELLLEAVFARHIADDASADGYAELLDGTIGDRNAHASRVSRQDRYHAFVRYYLYRQASTFMTELINFAWTLDKIRAWRIKDGT
jgi:hypothetical protein